MPKLCRLMNFEVDYVPHESEIAIKDGMLHYIQYGKYYRYDCNTGKKVGEWRIGEFTILIRVDHDQIRVFSQGKEGNLITVYKLGSDSNAVAIMRYSSPKGVVSKERIHWKRMPDSELRMVVLEREGWIERTFEGGIKHIHIGKHCNVISCPTDGYQSLCLYVNNSSNVNNHNLLFDTNESIDIGFNNYSPMSCVGILWNKEKIFYVRTNSVIGPGNNTYSVGEGETIITAIGPKHILAFGAQKACIYSLED